MEYGPSHFYQRKFSAMKTNKRYRLEAPEGGWGYVVCVGLALPFIQILGILPSFGLLFGEFLESIDAGTSAITTISSCFFSALSFAGLFANVLFKRFSIRKVAVFGGLLYFAGSLAQVFVQSTAHLVIAYGLMQGIASGLIVPALYTTFNHYFVKRRVMMMSVAQSLIGVGTMCYPVVVQTLNSWYGFRGCLLVVAALNAHAILGAVIMQPVEMHMRKVEVTESEMPAMERPVPHSGSKVSLSPSVRTYRSFSDKMSRRASSIASLGNWTGPIVANDIVRMEDKKPAQSSLWQKVVDFLDLTLFKDAVYVNIVFGMSVALNSDVAFFTLQSLYLFQLNYSHEDVAAIVAIGAAADLASRVVLAFGAAFLSVPSRYIFLSGAFFTIIARFAFLNTFDFVGMAIVTAILGFLRTWIHVTLPLVYGEYLTPERFPSGYGLFMFLQGNMMFVIGPVVGYVRDKTQDYTWAFHILNLYMAACVVPWLIEIICVKYRSRKLTK